MYFRYRLNMIYRDLPPFRNGVTLEIAPDHIVPWLGLIERDLVRAWASKLDARQVALSRYAGVTGWRVSELDAIQWLSEGQTFVGCLVDQGVFALIERGQPVIKRLPK